jgi:methionine aminopeptidase
LANTDGQLLIDATKDALDEGLATIKPGGLISDYAKKVSQTIKSR